MFCLSCGKKISRISKFCKYCGANQITDKKESEKNKATFKNNSIFIKISKISKITWFLCMAIFLAVAFASSKFDPDYKNIFSQIALYGSVIVGILSFLLMCLSLAIHFSFVDKKEKNFFIKIIFLFLSIIFLPLIVIKKQRKFFLSLLIFLPTWGIGIFLSLYIFGFISADRSIIGNSMNPTLQDKEIIKMQGFNFLNKLFFKPQKGDMVTFSSGTTVDDDGKLTDYIKRVVATEGDEIEIRDGFLYLNGQIVEEPYTAKARSTFGEGFLKECKKMTIPPNYIFVMGDNRKRSKDSRDIGFVSIDAINNILPSNKQSEFKDRLRDISHDKDNQGLPSFDLEDYYLRLNKIRTDNGLKPLKRNEKLENAAIARAKSIIENSEIDLLKSQNNSKYPYDKAIKDAGYYNILIGEVRTTGYYDSEELSNYWLEYETKKSILDKEYQDTGIGAYVGKIDGCEIQVIVQEFGGYIPPNYSKETINSWRDAVNSLNSVIPSWEKAKGWNNINQDDLNKLLDLMYRERNIASNILSKMESGKWLSDEENRSITEYDNLSNQSSALADKLNGN